MTRKFQKVTAVALAAVIVFWTMFPIPNAAIAQKKAYANPAVAVRVVVGTALVAAGVYVAATSTGEYDANLNRIVADLEDLAESAGQNLDEMCNAAINPDGTINLGALSQAGFFGLLPALYANYSAGNLAAVGESSRVPVVSTYQIGDMNFQTVDGALPFSNNQDVANAIATQSNSGSRPLAFICYKATPKEWNYVYSPYDKAYYHISEYQGVTRLVTSNGNNSSKSWPMVQVQLNDDGSVKRVSTNSMSYTFTPHVDWQDVTYYLSATTQIEIYHDDLTVEQGTALGSEVATFEPSVADGTFEAPSDVVEQFFVTDAMLEAGYTKADVTLADVSGQVDDVNGNLAQINTGIAALDTVLNTLLGVVQGIATNVANIWGVIAGIAAGPFSWLQAWWNQLTAWWNGLIAWLGSTPIGTLIGNASSAIEDAIDGLPVSGVLDGVNAIPGAITTGIGSFVGTLEGIRDGVLDIPSDIAGVAQGVLSIPAEIAAVLDGLLAAEAEATIEPGSGGLNISEDLKAQLNLMIETKAPFCYLKRFSNVASTVSGNFSSEPSFYLDVDIPYAGMQRFDAGPILNQQWGSMTLAQYMRLMLTASMCAGLLAVSVSMAMGVLKAKE